MSTSGSSDAGWEGPRTRNARDVTAARPQPAGGLGFGVGWGAKEGVADLCLPPITFVWALAAQGCLPASPSSPPKEIPTQGVDVERGALEGVPAAARQRRECVGREAVQPAAALLDLGRGRGAGHDGVCGV
jgi:hypothetical protein